MRDRRFSRYSDFGPMDEDRMRRFRERSRWSRMVFGIMVSCVGLFLLLKMLGLVPVFLLNLHLSWPFWIILLGLFIGIKSRFRNNSWWILIVIGLANEVPAFEFMGRPSSELVWPALLIAVGITIAFRPRRGRCYPVHSVTSSISAESVLNIEATFGGRKEVVTSKDFKGGSITITFGGCELNLMQADFQEPSIVLDCKVSFGGLEIIVPSHWEVQNEINPAFGNVEDARGMSAMTGTEPKKVLILRGNCSFGNIELKSY